MNKIARKAFILLLLFMWFLSGWPVIWQNPRVPPKINEVKAATLSTLRPVTPDGTITNYQNESSGITNLYTSIDDDPDSPTTSDYVKNSSSVNASVFFNLTDTPSDFGSMDTLQIDFYLNAPANWSDDTGTLYAQVFQSDETTTLTSEHQLATHSTGVGYYSVTFTTVTGSDKTTWDGAWLRLRVAYSKTKGPDNGQIQVAAVELDGTYTVAAVVSVSVSDGVVTYGTMPANTSKTTLSGELNDLQTATNDGTVAENFNIKGQNSANWTLTASAGSEQYVHEFSTNAGGNWTALTTNYQTLGTNIAASGTKTFDLKAIVPTSTAYYSQQSIDVTVQAVQN